MDMRAAMRDTLTLAIDRVHDGNVYNAGLSSQDGINTEHLESMVERVEAGEFSEAKLGRWLGYMQGVLVACGTATLDEMKEINKKHADK